MNYLPITILLDMAGDFASLRDLAWTQQRRESAMIKLAQIDEELLSRMPTGEFVTLLDYPEGDMTDLNYWLHAELEPVGFEPECYSRLAEAQIELLDADYATDQLIGLDLGV